MGIPLVSQAHRSMPAFVQRSGRQFTAAKACWVPFNGIPVVYYMPPRTGRLTASESFLFRAISVRQGARAPQPTQECNTLIGPEKGKTSRIRTYNN